MAVRLGIAPRRLWGWEPATTHTYDEQGRVLTSRPEPEWDAEQYALVAALSTIEDDECPGCHGSMSETTSPDSDPDGDGSHRYEATAAVRCHKCTARELKAKQYADADAPSALRYPVHRVPRRTT